MSDKKKKDTGLTRDEIIGICLITGSAILGYKVGVRIADRQFDKGLDTLFAVDPSLKTHFWEAVTKVKFGNK